jgi:hypothetical protein
MGAVVMEYQVREFTSWSLGLFVLTSLRGRAELSNRQVRTAMRNELAEGSHVYEAADVNAANSP